jgi:hypothetical protein
MVRINVTVALIIIGEKSRHPHYSTYTMVYGRCDTESNDTHTQPGKSYWGGWLSTIDLLVLTSLDLLLFKLKMSFTFVTKQPNLLLVSVI